MKRSEVLRFSPIFRHVTAIGSSPEQLQPRPLRADAARNRARLLEAARDLFAQRGLNVTMDEIARHAGVGVGTAYRRFASREELIEALFDELRDESHVLLVATHDVAQARRFDRVLCLNRAQIAYGDPAAVLTADTLRATYGAEIIDLGEGGLAVAVDHYDHGHAH